MHRWLIHSSVISVSFPCLYMGTLSILPPAMAAGRGYVGNMGESDRTNSDIATRPADHARGRIGSTRHDGHKCGGPGGIPPEPLQLYEPLAAKA